MTSVEIKRHESLGYAITSTKASISRFFHEFDEVVEEVVRVVRAG